MIRSTSSRALLRPILRAQRDLDASYGQTLKNLVSLESALMSIQKECQAEAGDHLAARIAVVHLYALAFGHLAIAVHPNAGNAGPFPATWINPTGKPDPNFILSQGLVQVVNNALAVVRLSCDGFDPQARVLVRVTGELTWQLAVLFSSPELIGMYAGAQTEDEENRVWWDLFGRGRLLKRMQELDELIGLPPHVSAALHQHRRGHQRYYSNSVHPSVTVVGLGSHSRSFGESRFRWALFGAVGTASAGTLGAVIESLFLASAVLPAVFGKFGSLEKLHSRAEWKDFQEIADTASALRVEVYRSKKSTANKQMQRTRRAQAMVPRR
jgi:hypothetical protein